MYYIISKTLLALSFAISLGCTELFSQYASKNSPQSIEALIDNLEDSNNKEIIVVAHRGDWRHAPENSLQAIQNCIDMGVDMVEIDVRRTKDGHLVLMHDETIDRTTNGTGRVEKNTLAQLKELRLLDGLGIKTEHQVPTLEEAFLVTKDKILVNLDKSYEIFEECYHIAKTAGTLDQIIIKGVKSHVEVEQEFGKYLDEVYFMPIVRLPDTRAKQLVDDYLDNRLPIAFEFTLKYDSLEMIDYFDDIRKKGAGVWVNSLWPQHNGGHDDEKAALDPSVYDWFIDNAIDIIQTDRPQLLINYLRSKGLHD
ncbi:MAG: glycerophosphoryl diester phosphodiesterase [Halioglobus sp.]|jgi:glycerophosphoryl diester phosphodiesterase